MRVDCTSRQLNIALATVVVFQLGLCLFFLIREHFFNISTVWGTGLHVGSVIVLAGIACVYQLHQTQLSRRAESSQEQLDAMLNMLGTVRHKLNNDMQVVLGNAELAEILINAGGDVSKPVHNISDAANDAVERIEQLTVIGSTRKINPKPFDLNATLRESMARLAAEMPSGVNLRLELDNLSSQVMADRYLLSLSLSHLIRQASESMYYGGEIIVRTNENSSSRVNDHGFITAEIHIINVQAQTKVREVVGKTAAAEKISSDEDALQVGLNNTRVIVERSGVQSVRLSCTGDESLFAMRFRTSAQPQPDAPRNELLVSQFLG